MKISVSYGVRSQCETFHFPVYILLFRYTVYDTDLVHFVPTVVYIGAYIGRIWGVYGVFGGVLGVYMMYIWCLTGVNMCVYGYKGV